MFGLTRLFKASRGLAEAWSKPKSVLEASRRGELVLFYQPKVDMTTGFTVGVEALLRWEHPRLGLISPAMFKHALKPGTDGIINVGQWAIQVAIRQISEWNRAGLTIPVSVNVLASELTSGDFFAWLREVFIQYPDVSPAMLELEIVESSNLSDVQSVIRVLLGCRSMGVKFALDDFGTGYSSLSYVRNLPADNIKIDQTFVKNIASNHQDRGLVQVVINLANTFDCTVIAEGVESIEQGLILMQLGCKYAQGYLIAKPMLAADIPGWIEQYKGHPEWIGCELQVFLWTRKGSSHNQPIVQPGDPEQLELANGTNG